MLNTVGYKCKDFEVRTRMPVYVFISQPGNKLVAIAFKCELN